MYLCSPGRVPGRSVTITCGFATHAGARYSGRASTADDPRPERDDAGLLGLGLRTRSSRDNVYGKARRGEEHGMRVGCGSGTFRSPASFKTRAPRLPGTGSLVGRLLKLVEAVGPRPAHASHPPCDGALSTSQQGPAVQARRGTCRANPGGLLHHRPTSAPGPVA